MTYFKANVANCCLGLLRVLCEDCGQGKIYSDSVTHRTTFDETTVSDNNNLELRVPYINKY